MIKSRGSLFQEVLEAESELVVVLHGDLSTLGHILEEHQRHLHRALYTYHNNWLCTRLGSEHIHYVLWRDETLFPMYLCTNV